MMSNKNLLLNLVLRLALSFCQQTLLKHNMPFDLIQLTSLFLLITYFPSAQTSLKNFQKFYFTLEFNQKSFTFGLEYDQKLIDFALEINHI